MGCSSPSCPSMSRSTMRAEFKDADGTYATWRVMLSAIAYNKTLVKPEDVPKGFRDLLDPKWSGKMVKAHPSYSGTIMTATHQMARDLGWEYFEKLALQKIMQVQSAADPPKKIALGERALMVDGGDYIVSLEIEKGAPLEIVYPVRGHAADHRTIGRHEACPKPECREALLPLELHAGGAAGDASMSARYARRMRLVKDRPDRTAAQGHQADEGECRRGGESRPTISRSATLQYFKV